MPARTGGEYLAGLRDQPREVWLDGVRVADVTTHSGTRRGAASVALLYDMQHDPKLRDEMTYTSPSSGDRVGLSFITPANIEELERRRKIIDGAYWEGSSTVAIIVRLRAGKPFRISFRTEDEVNLSKLLT